MEEVEERKYFPRGHEQGDDHADNACRHACPPRHAQHFLVARLRAAALVEVDAERRGNGVDVGRNSAHRGCEHGGNQQPRHAGGQLAHHEEGEDDVGLLHREVHRSRVGLIERVQPRADYEEHDRHAHAHRAVHQDALPCAALVLGGEVTLYDGLVGGVRNEVVGHAAEYDYPERCGAVVETPVEETELACLAANGKEALKAALGAEDQEYGRQHRTAHKDKALHHVAPHHGLNAAHRAIEYRDATHQHDAHIYIYARHGRERERGEIEHQRHARHHEHDEQGTGHEARGSVEAALEIFVRARHVEPAEERQVVADDGERHEEYGDEHRVVRPVGGEGFGRIGHIRDGGKHRGVDAHARRPPRHAAAACEEVACTALAPHEIVAEQHHADEIGGQHRPVEQAEVGAHVQRHLRHIGSPHAGLLLAAHQQPTPGGKRYQTCAGTRQQGRLRLGDPSVGNRVINKQFVSEAIPFCWVAQIFVGLAFQGCQLLCGGIALRLQAAEFVGTVNRLAEHVGIYAAEAHDVAAARGGGICADERLQFVGAMGLDRGDAAPCHGAQVEDKAVGMYRRTVCARGVVAAEEVEVAARRSILHHGAGLHSPRPRHVGQALPLRAAGIAQAERAVRGCAIGLATQYIYIASAKRARRIVEPNGQGRQRRCLAIIIIYM